jgi:hypothetical protein
VKLDELRRGCAAVAARAGQVHVRRDRIAAYAAPLGAGEIPAPAPSVPDPESTAAFWLTLDAVNFGSGWFPTLRKAPGATGYRTVAAGIRRRFDARGPWSAAELAAIEPPEIAGWTGQDPEHPLMELFARSLRDLGTQVRTRFDGRFLALARASGGSAPGLAELLEGFESFADEAEYQGLRLPFLKRAQIAAADLHRAGVIAAPDLAGLTMFADNLVPHVLRLDGVLEFEPELVARIERGELLTPGSAEEVEIRACAVHAVELIAAELPGLAAATIDERLWQRGQGARYKAVPRHRCRSTAY